MRHVYLTSYLRSHALPEGVTAYSCTVYPPRGYEHYPKIVWTDIRNGGAWTRPRNFIGLPDPPAAYHDALYALYVTRLDEARAWAASLLSDVALCCWCPYDRSAQRQLEDHGSFICHTEVLAEFIERELGLRVWLDFDRRRMKALA